MPATERYQVDFFAIIVLIAAVLIIVFLVIASIYFFNLMNLRPPTRGESTFLFWTAIILTIIFFAIAIYALIHILTHKAIVYEEPAPVRTAPITSTPSVPIVIPQPQPFIQQPVIQQPVITTPTSVPIYRVPRSNLSTSLSDVPLDVKGRDSLNNELIELDEALTL